MRTSWSRGPDRRTRIGPPLLRDSGAGGRGCGNRRPRAARSRVGRASPGPPERTAMSRALWSGTVSFGLVEIPVSLHTAENAAHELRFHLLDRRTMKPVGYNRVNK